MVFKDREIVSLDLELLRVVMESYDVLKDFWKRLSHIDVSIWKSCSNLPLFLL